MGDFLIEKIEPNLINVTIKSSSTNLLASIALFCLGILCLIFPLSLIFIDELSVGFGYIITLVIFLGTSIYFFRLFLWNKFGREVYILSSDNLSYYYDYKLFKDNLNVIEKGNFKIGYFKALESNEVFLNFEKNENNFKCYLAIILDNKTVKSKFLVSYKDIQKMTRLYKKSLC